MPALLCDRCGADLPAEAARSSVSCPFCGATCAPPARVVERMVEELVLVPVSGRGDAPACPRCGEALRRHAVGWGSEMDPTEQRGVVLGCPACGGVMVDAATVAHLRTARAPAVEDVAHRLSAAGVPLVPRVREAAIQCPLCAAPLQRESIFGSIWAVDACAEHGTWFDRRELESYAQIWWQRRRGDVDDEGLETAGIPTESDASTMLSGVLKILSFLV